MPSLSSLKEFRASLGNVANERPDIEAGGLRFDALELPDTEAPPFDPREQAVSAPASVPAASPDTADSVDTSAEEASPADGGFDFSAFLGSLPSDTSPPPIDDAFQEAPVSDMPVDDAAGAELSSEASADDGLPPANDLFDTQPEASSETSVDKDALPSDDFFDSLGLDTHEDSSADAPVTEESVDSETLPVETDFPTDGLETETSGSGSEDGALGIDDSAIADDTSTDAVAPEESSPSEPAPPLEDASSEEDLPAFDDIDFPAADESSDTPSEESVDLGGDFADSSAAAADTGDGAESSGDSAAGNVVLDDVLPDFDSDIDFSGSGEESENAEVSDDSGAGELPDIDFSGFDESGGAEEESGDSGLEGIDYSAMDVTSSSGDGIEGDLGSAFSSDTIELDNDDSSAPQSQDDEFALPGLDEIFEKTKKDPFAQPPAQKKGLFGRKKPDKAEEAEEEEEELDINDAEIKLTQNQLDKLMATLAGYPLNLRVACEELIAEHVLLPEQLAKIIRLLVKGASAKEAAAFAGEILGKQIVIPKSFAKGTGEAWEAERSSFAYIFVHKFLPILRLFTFITVMAASVIYLGYKFIYIPAKAEGLYKRGYERIFADEYQRANELFHEAFIIHRKKPWFYRYAEGFRDKRRYLLAEQKYDELLRYYPRDKKGVLDYAHLQTYYLLNYDKANRLLQQQLLDYAPND
jgi:hypothetical protein